MLRWAENILEDMKRVRAHMVEMGEDIARSACCRVGLVKSSYKEISSNILRPSEVRAATKWRGLQGARRMWSAVTRRRAGRGQVNAAYSSCKTRLVLLDMDLLRPSKEEMEEGGDVVWQQTLGSIELLLKEAGNCVFLLSSNSPENLLNVRQRQLPPRAAVAGSGRGARELTREGGRC